MFQLGVQRLSHKLAVKLIADPAQADYELVIYARARQGRVPHFPELYGHECHREIGRHSAFCSTACSNGRHRHPCPGTNLASVTSNNIFMEILEGVNGDKVLENIQSAGQIL